MAMSNYHNSCDIDLEYYLKILIRLAPFYRYFCSFFSLLHHKKQKINKIKCNNLVWFINLHILIGLTFMKAIGIGGGGGGLIQI